MSAEEHLPKLAFLGPLGSHSYACAKSGFGESVEYVERRTITDVFNAVSPEIPFGLLPQENSVFGTVTETYDLLRQPAAGTDRFVRGELVLPIRHSLVVRRGVRLEDVERVLSHEQALGQCSRFLSERLPGAARIKTPSTSAAAKSLLADDGDDDDDDDSALKSAAICAGACVTVFDGLEVLCEGIQNVDTNRTRFYLVCHSPEGTLPAAFQAPVPQHALVRIGLKPAPSPANADGDASPPASAPAPAQPRNRLVHLVMSTLLTTFGLPMSRIDRRPSLADAPFEDVYLVELEASSSLLERAPGEESDAACAALWSRVKAGVAKIEAVGGEAAVLGIW